MLDVECEARWLLRGFDRPPGARALARHHLGPDAIVRYAGLRGGDAMLFEMNHRPAIAVRAKLPRVDERWAITHEVVEWHLQQIGYRSEDAELEAERLTGALVAPRDSFLRAIRTHGSAALGQLAFDFTASQTCVALRVGETTGEPTVVLAPTTIRVRGDEWEWPDEQSLRQLARTRPANLRCLDLTDARRRMVLSPAA